MSVGKDFARSYWPGVMLLVVSVLISLGTYKDYGISWDEKIQRALGEITYNYVTHGDQTLRTTEERNLGTGFELPLIYIEKWLNLGDTRDIYLARHLATHFFFLLGAFCGYVLAFRLFKKQFIACLGFILIAFHPRMYAHSYFNTKDIPFLSAFLIALLVSHIAFEKNKPLWHLILGIACGYATSIRDMGLMLVAIFCAFFLLDVISKLYRKEKVLPVVINAIIFNISFCGSLYAVWPVLWGNPFAHIQESIHHLVNIPWSGKVLMMNKFYSGNELPWFYMPVWLFITLPEILLIAGVTGIIWLASLFMRTPSKYLTNTPERNYVLYFACFIGPILAITILHGVNIDDWRHIYFIYPSFVMLSLFAINKALQGIYKYIVEGLCAAQIMITGLFMVNNHPHQQVYFNHFVSHKDEYLRKNYDLDYWGCAYKQGIEHILAQDNSDTIRLLHSIVPPNNLMMIPMPERKRIKMVGDLEKPTYFITNFRMHPDDYPYPNVVYEIKVLNSTIMRVYKLDKKDKLP